MKRRKSKIKRSYVRVAPKGSSQPRTLIDLIADPRVWVTPDGCWLWLGGDDGYGDADGRGSYGRILRPGTRRVMPVHKYVCEFIKGEVVPPGWHIDHLCCEWAIDKKIIRRCVNPDHLEPVPGAINQQRKMLRRWGYDVDDLPEYKMPEGMPERPPILAPGETLEDLEL